MQTRRLGATELEVTRLSLGSWRTFERIGRDDGLALMRAAREHGINFLDDARYDDETGHAPLPTGYSEVLFGELFRAAGWDRETTVVSNKLEMRAALEAAGAGVIASFVMAGGVLTGKYDTGASGRAAGELDSPRYRAARALGERLRGLATERGVSPAALAIAFALANPSVASVLFGATSAAQLTDNVSALSVDSAPASNLASLVSGDPALDQETGD